MNERYTDEARQGKGVTRKSAASAKPKTVAAASVRPASKAAPKKKRGLFSKPQPKTPEEEKAERKAQEKAEKRAASGKPTQKELERMYYNPPTPEYKKWRRIWWVVIALAIVSVVLSMVVQQCGLGGEYQTALIFTFMALAYAFVIAAFIIDFVVIKKIRKRYVASLPKKKGKAGRAEDRAAAEQARKEAEERAAAGVVEEPKKGFFSKFGSKPKGGVVENTKAAVAGAKDAAAGAKMAVEEAQAAKADSADSADSAEKDSSEN